MDHRRILVAISGKAAPHHLSTALGTPGLRRRHDFSTMHAGHGLSRGQYGLLRFLRWLGVGTLRDLGGIHFESASVVSYEVFLGGSSGWKRLKT